MTRIIKRYARMLISVLLLLAAVSSADADAGFLLAGMKSDQVFEITLLWDNGTSYRHYAFVDGEQSICEIDASGAVGRCQVDLFSLAEAFKQVPVVDYIPRLPDSIHWGAEADTPVVLAVIIKEWSAADQRASQWQLACSLLPGNETLAVCLQADRIDHFNYMTVQAEPLMHLIAGLNG